MEDLAQALLKGCTKEKDRQVVSLDVCKAIAEEKGIPLRDVELAALNAGIVPKRYERNIGTLGITGQIGLLRSRVAVVGCGGLGGWIAEVLGRVGVGELLIIDGDSFSENNLNRQLFCTEKSLGLPKVQVAAERLAVINSALTVVPMNVLLTEENADRLLGSANLAIDALDNNSSRKVLFEACRRLRIPVVHGAIGGLSGEVGTVFPGDPTLFDALKGDVPDRGIETVLGNPSFTPAVTAALQVAEAVKVITGVGTPLRASLLWIDLEEMEFQKLRL